MKKIIALFSILLLAGCSQDWKAHVESNVNWSGTFGGVNVSGSGEKVVDLNDDVGNYCCVVRKDTTIGFLKVTLINDGSGWIFDADSKTGQTSEPYGEITVCK